eukprot:SAG31_NODE_242_length_19350_cov_3.043998_1_plen_418_part_00
MSKGDWDSCEVLAPSVKRLTDQLEHLHKLTPPTSMLRVVTNGCGYTESETDADSDGECPTENHGKWLARWNPTYVRRHRKPSPRRPWSAAPALQSQVVAKSVAAAELQRPKLDVTGLRGSELPAQHRKASAGRTDKLSATDTSRSANRPTSAPVQRHKLLLRPFATGLAFTTAGNTEQNVQADTDVTSATACTFTQKKVLDTDATPVRSLRVRRADSRSKKSENSSNDKVHWKGPAEKRAKEQSPIQSSKVVAAKDPDVLHSDRPSKPEKDNWERRSESQKGSYFHCPSVFGILALRGVVVENEMMQPQKGFSNGVAAAKLTEPQRHSSCTEACEGSALDGTIQDKADEWEKKCTRQEPLSARITVDHGEPHMYELWRSANMAGPLYCRQGEHGQQKSTVREKQTPSGCKSARQTGD